MKADKIESYFLTGQAASLLHNVLQDHLENLVHGDGSDEEIELTEILIHTFKAEDVEESA